mmetsp:Transcript_25620/g.55802  ORF Transcript_25620/g.55802 Transcript_25620/m.55802 type:complete len:460 (+) Transcript_25620:120-1499(+)|eukprot:CAMPEP_0202904548 /NCGR_PEP_ID=MMETSP1392-20130828/29902_1 /ASSEMBLY_ACC=CAM_ASM_000868 /TAXON_ID=225041 /ORGANISM="Chlamydomonas chlamydogama, Strain SAG 11-48b" /LENGTH=459 /DNA_ID=CAMNT_0049592209 /DNA_START=57 /DNA_END=1436 /DNA_ORIENTATION=+
MFNQHAQHSQPGSTLPPKPPKFPPKFDKGEKIGEGTYGWVYHARSKETGGRFAVKQFKGGREGDGVSPTAIREIMLLRELKHPNIVHLDSVHINRSEPSLWLAFDYAEHDLFEMIKYHRDCRDNRLMHHHVIKSVMWQLLNGLSYLHQNWIIHRDLKPSNVLVMGDDAGPEQHGIVKIADFGLARIFQAPPRPLSDNGVVVTIWYRAPELLLGAKHYTRAVDVWAAGCIFAELCMLRPLFQGQERKGQGYPFQGDQLEKIFRVLGHPNPRHWQELEHLHHWHDNTENVRVRRSEYPSSSQLETSVLDTMKQALPSAMQASASIPSTCRPPPEAFKLLARMLDYNPATRITAEEALQHPYFTADPRPNANVFVLPATIPGGQESVIKYPKRQVAHAGSHDQAGGAGQQGPPPPPPSRSAAQAALPPGMRPSGMYAAASGGNTRKRPADGSSGRNPPPGFR